MVLIVAFARPQALLREDDIQADGIDIMLTLDLSSSMLAQDFEPDRLEVAKKVAANFVEKREFDRIGLIVFKGKTGGTAIPFGPFLALGGVAALFFGTQLMQFYLPA